MNCRCRHGWISTILCRMGEERHENILQGLSRWSGGENCEVPMQGVPVWSLVRELRSTCHEAQPKKIKNKNGEGDNTLQWHNVLRSHFQLCRVTASSSWPGLDALIWKALCSSKAWVQGQIDSRGLHRHYLPGLPASMRSNKLWPQDFPGGPVFKTPSSQYRGHGFDPWLGNWDPACYTVRHQKNNDPWQRKERYDSHGNSFPGQRLQ